MANDSQPSTNAETKTDAGMIGRPWNRMAAIIAGRLFRLSTTDNGILMSLNDELPRAMLQDNNLAYTGTLTPNRRRR